MINALWLLLIIPATAVLVLGLVALLFAADDSDERMIALLREQYKEMRDLARRVYDTAQQEARHALERREIEG